MITVMFCFLGVLFVLVAVLIFISAAGVVYLVVLVWFLVFIVGVACLFRGFMHKVRRAKKIRLVVYRRRSYVILHRILISPGYVAVCLSSRGVSW